MKFVGQNHRDGVAMPQEFHLSSAVRVVLPKLTTIKDQRPMCYAQLVAYNVALASVMWALCGVPYGANALP